MTRWMAWCLLLAACAPDVLPTADAAIDIDAEVLDAEIPCGGPCDDGNPCTSDFCVDGATR